MLNVSYTQRGVFSKTAQANEVSVSCDVAEQPPTSDSRLNAEPSSPQASRPRAEQNRQLASCIGTEQSTELASSLNAEHQNSHEPSPEADIDWRFSMDSIPDIDRSSRQQSCRVQNMRCLCVVRAYVIVRSCMYLYSAVYNKWRGCCRDEQQNHNNYVCSLVQDRHRETLCHVLR